MKQKSVLMLGLFLDKRNGNSNIRTVEDRIATMFCEADIATITSSAYSNRIIRLFHTIYTIIRSTHKYNIALIPLFGTRPSFLWQEVVTRLLKILNKKIVLSIHGGSIPGRIEKGAQHFYKAMKRADELVVPSLYLSAYFNKEGFKTHIIENPINLSAYIFIPKKILRPRILWMRAFDEEYNPEMAIRVAGLLSKKYSDLTMVMAGKDDGMLNEIKRLSKRNQLENKISFPGYINMQQKLEYAQTHDIYICTNRIDNAPVSLIEFMALGLPIVSVNTGGIPYMIKDGYNGLLVDLDDDEAMANKIEMLIKNPELSCAISRNAYKYSRQYGEEYVLKKWLTILNN